jgi:membrane protease subunit HflK
MPGGSMGGKGVIALLLLGTLLWLATGFYTVRPNEVGLNLRFGRFIGQSGEGLRYNWPYPIGQVIKPSVTTVQRTEVGYRSGGGPRGGNRDVLEESLMLTGDGNIVDIDFDVQWQIDAARAENYVFNLQNPDGTIKSVAESAMREVIGRRQIQNILTIEQASIAQEVQALSQGALDAYGAGVRITVVQLQAAVPPAQVREAFFDVNAAQQDAVRLQNEAETYASRSCRKRAVRLPRSCSRPRPIASAPSPTPRVRRAVSTRSMTSIAKRPTSRASASSSRPWSGSSAARTRC